MENRLFVNGYLYSEHVTLAQIRKVISRYDCKLERAYTFEMRNGFRRVIKLIAQGDAYIVSTRQGLSFGSIGYSETPHLLTFNRKKADKLANEIRGNVETFEKAKIDFTQKHVQRLLKGLRY